MLVAEIKNHCVRGSSNAITARRPWMRQMAAEDNSMLVGKKSVRLFTLSGVDGVLNDDGEKIFCVH